MTITLVAGLGVILLATWLGKFPPPKLSLAARLAIVSLAVVVFIVIGWLLNG